MLSSGRTSVLGCRTFPLEVGLASSEPPLGKTTMRKLGAAYKWTADRRKEVRALIEPIAEDLTRVQHRFGPQDVVEVLGQSGIKVPKRIVASILHEMEAEGLLEYRGASHLGWSWVAPVPPPPTLEALVNFAETCISAHVQPRKGRQAEFEDPSVEAINRGQFDNIKTVANLIAKYTPGANGDWAAVTADYFGWDETANNGRGDWAICARVLDYSDRQHREKHEAKGGDGQRRAKKNTMRTKHLGSVRLLLNLAATHGRILRTTRKPGPPRAFAVMWGPHVKRWIAGLVRRFPDASPAMIQQGVSVLARYGTRLGTSSASSTPWLRVKDLIVADRAAGVLSRSSFGNARFVWRLVLDLLSARFEVPETAAWPTERDSRMQLVEDHLLAEIVDHFHGDVEKRRTTKFDFKRLVDPLGRKVMGLINGAFGLADWLVWSTETDDYLARHGLPPREFIDPDDRMKEHLRRAKKMSGALYWLAPATLLGRLRMLFHYAGWCQTSREADWSKDALNALVDPDRFKKYAEDLLARNEGGGAQKLSEAARALAIIASPYLEARALQCAHTEVDDKLRDVFRERAAVFRSAGRDLRDWASDHKVSGNASKNIEKISTLWGERGGCTGYHKLLTLRTFLIDAVVAGATKTEYPRANRHDSCGPFHPNARLGHRGTCCLVGCPGANRSRAIANDGGAHGGLVPRGS